MLQQQSTPAPIADEAASKQKPKRTRQRKNAGAAGATTNTSLSKGKKSAAGGCAPASTAATSATNPLGVGAQTPPVSIPPMGFIAGTQSTGTTVCINFFRI